MSSGGRLALEPEPVLLEREQLGPIGPTPMSTKRRCPKPSEPLLNVAAQDPLLPMIRICEHLLQMTALKADANSKPPATAASRFDTSRLPLAVVSLSPHR